MGVRRLVYVNTVRSVLLAGICGVIQWVTAFKVSSPLVAVGWVSGTKPKFGFDIFTLPFYLWGHTDN